MNTTRDLVENRLGRIEFTLMLSMTMSLGALAIDMILPAMGDLRAEFGLAPDSNDIAAIITFFLFGMSLGQMVWGPLSDVFGRKRILYVGIAIYLVGAIASSLSPTLTALFASRFVWGVGAAGAVVITRSIIRDTYEGEAMARALSFIMAVFLLVPIVAPTLGAAVLVVGPWQWIFISTAAIAALVAIWTLRLPETLPVDRRIRLHAGDLARAARFVLSNRMTMGYTLAQMAVFGLFVSYLASSQLFLDDIFDMGDWFPVFFGALAMVMGAVILANTQLLHRFALRPLLRSAFAFFLVGGILFLVVMLATGGHPPFVVFFIALLPILIAHALLIPNLNAVSMIPMASVAGTASAIIGTVTTLGGSLIGLMIDSSYNGSLIPFGVAAAAIGVIAFGLMVWADRAYEQSTTGLEKTPATGDSIPTS